MAQRVGERWLKDEREMAQRWERERSGREMTQTLGGRVGERWLREWERDGSKSEMGERDGSKSEMGERDGSKYMERDVKETL